MRMRLSEQDLHMLSALAAGEQPMGPSRRKTSLKDRGLIEHTPDGWVLTERGRLATPEPPDLDRQAVAREAIEHFQTLRDEGWKYVQLAQHIGCTVQDLTELVYDEDGPLSISQGILGIADEGLLDRTRQHIRQLLDDGAKSTSHISRAARMAGRNTIARLLKGDCTTSRWNCLNILDVTVENANFGVRHGHD